MFRYDTLGYTPRQVRSLTGISPQAFLNLAQRVWEEAPDSHLGRPHKHSYMVRLFITLLHLRTNLTERQLAAFYDLSPSNIHENIARYEKIIAGLLPAPNNLDKRYLYIVDGTMLPTHDRTRTAKSKNYRRSVATQVVVRRKDRIIVAVSPNTPGSRHDARAWRESDLPDKFLGYNLIGDGGYQGCDNVTSPRRGADQKIVKDAAYKRFRKRRATAEHVLAELKTFQILRQVRRKGDNIDTIIQACSVLHNLARQEDYAYAA